MEQLLVPAGTASVLDAAVGGIDLAVVAACCVTVGQRTEIDLAVLATRDEALCEALAEYWHQTRRFHALRRRGQAAGLECLVVRRPLGLWRQETGRHKRDLGPQLAALERLGPSVANDVAALLDASHAEGEASLELVVLDQGLDAELGGIATPCEQRRVLRLTARYAGWRDRRVRRLASVEAFADEVWPVPTAAVTDRLAGR